MEKCMHCMHLDLGFWMASQGPAVCGPPLGSGLVDAQGGELSYQLYGFQGDSDYLAD
jgi:hypothetical protein